MLNYLHGVSLFQWSLIVAGVMLLVWPYIVEVAGWFFNPSPPARRPSFDDIVLFRQTIADDEAAVKAFDELIVPAIVKRCSE